MTRPWRVALAALLLAGCASGAGQGPSDEASSVPVSEIEGFRAAPPGSGVDRYRDQDVDWRECGRFQCADVAVPLDWAEPDDHAITVSLLKRPAEHQPARGTVFVNPGGPGASGKDLAEVIDTSSFADHDVIGWDPRGAGSSTPVQCGSDEDMDEYLSVDTSPDSPDEDEALRAAAQQFADRCVEESGRLLQHISTVDTVADLDLLRHLVGEEKLDFLGFSYGTEIGAVYAATHPDRVGHMVLDSPVSLEPDPPVPQIVGFERAFENFAQWCAEMDCGLGVDRPAVTANVVDLLRQLDAEPLDVEGRRLTQSVAVSGMLLPLYQTEEYYPWLAEALTDARTGDGRGLLELADRYYERGSDGHYGQLLTSFAAIRCVSESRVSVDEARKRQQRDEQRTPVLGEFVGPDYECPVWGVPPKPNPTDYTATGDAPILVIGARLDSATPYENAVDMAETFETSILVTWDGAGHGTYGGTSTCIDDAVARYFQDDLPAEGLTCTP